MHIKGAFTLHPRSRSEHTSPSSDAIKTSELMFRVYTDPSPCPRLLSRTSVSELVATCSDFLGHGRPSSSEVMKRACSKLPVHVVATKFGPKWQRTRMTSDPSLGCSVNTILSGSRTRTRTRMLRQCKCKCALTHKGTEKLLWTQRGGNSLPPVWGLNLCCLGMCKFHCVQIILL